MGVDFSSDGKHIVSASDDKTARLWNATTGKEIATLHGHTDRIGSALFSDDGADIATASHDETARIWDVDSRQTIRILLHPTKVYTAAFSPDGSQIVTASGSTRAGLGQRDRRQTSYDRSRGEENVPRCLTPEQRKEFFLDAEPPLWCIERKKWPYHTKDWQQWLAETRAGSEPTMPVQ